MPQESSSFSACGYLERAQILSRRDFLGAATALLMSLGLPSTGLAGEGRHGSGGSGQRMVVVMFGGVRRAETFSPQGIENIPHLSGEMVRAGPEVHGFWMPKLTWRQLLLH